MFTFAQVISIGYRLRFTAKTLYGLEDVLTNELSGLGASETEPLNRAVAFSGTYETMYRVNYCSRTALSVLMPVAEFTITSGDELYSRALKIKWSEYMDSNDTFSVVPVVNSKLFRHTAYPALVLKDAVADHFRRRSGKRPSVDTADPVIIINLHISNNRVTVSLDSTGDPLYKRGYRSAQGAAPLNEILAAGIIMLSGWNGSVPLLDPMCESGTIPIEAGLIACKIPPGRLRKKFAFTRWREFDNELFERIKREAEEGIIKPATIIKASDISADAVGECRTNIANAGLTDVIQVEVCDFKDIKAESGKGIIIMNPPYGKRIVHSAIEYLYSMIGTSLKHNFPGNTAWIITTEKDYLNKIGLRPVKKYRLYNGAIECVLAGYELYEGSVRKTKN